MTVGSISACSSKRILPPSSPAKRTPSTVLLKRYHSCYAVVLVVSLLVLLCNEPNLVQAQTPTFVPIKTPSASPSNTPSANPSESPSNTPSASPSESPSSLPSTHPTGAPSTTPSIQPTFIVIFDYRVRSLLLTFSGLTSTISNSQKWKEWELYTSEYITDYWTPNDASNTNPNPCLFNIKVNTRFLEERYIDIDLEVRYEQTLEFDQTYVSDAATECPLSSEEYALQIVQKPFESFAVRSTYVEFIQEISGGFKDTTRISPVLDDVPSFPTFGPTATPTLTPSVNPTVVPTLNPTNQPIISPTFVPTVKPTGVEKSETVTDMVISVYGIDELYSTSLNLLVADIETFIEEYWTEKGGQSLGGGSTADIDLSSLFKSVSNEASDNHKQSAYHLFPIAKFNTNNRSIAQNKDDTSINANRVIQESLITAEKGSFVGYSKASMGRERHLQQGNAEEIRIQDIRITLYCLNNSPFDQNARVAFIKATVNHLINYYISPENGQIMIAYDTSVIINRYEIIGNDLQIDFEVDMEYVVDNYNAPGVDYTPLGLIRNPFKTQDDQNRYIQELRDTNDRSDSFSELCGISNVQCVNICPSASPTISFAPTDSEPTNSPIASPITISPTRSPVVGPTTTPPTYKPTFPKTNPPTSNTIANVRVRETDITSLSPHVFLKDNQSDETKRLDIRYTQTIDYTAPYPSFTLDDPYDLFTEPFAVPQDRLRFVYQFLENVQKDYNDDNDDVLNYNISTSSYVSDISQPKYYPPTDIPTLNPSEPPKVTSNPTNLPTLNPSRYPVATLTLPPTNKPLQPTREPSSYPTLAPTLPLQIATLDRLSLQFTSTTSQDLQLLDITNDLVSQAIFEETTNDFVNLYYVIGNKGGDNEICISVETKYLSSNRNRRLQIGDDNADITTEVLFSQTVTYRGHITPEKFVERPFSTTENRNYYLDLIKANLPQPAATTDAALEPVTSPFESVLSISSVQTSKPNGYTIGPNLVRLSMELIGLTLPLTTTGKAVWSVSLKVHTKNYFRQQVLADADYSIFDVESEVTIVNQIVDENEESVLVVYEQRLNYTTDVDLQDSNDMDFKVASQPFLKKSDQTAFLQRILSTLKLDEELIFVSGMNPVSLYISSSPTTNPTQTPTATPTINPSKENMAGLENETQEVTDDKLDWITIVAPLVIVLCVIALVLLVVIRVRRRRIQTTTDRLTATPSLPTREGSTREIIATADVENSNTHPSQLSQSAARTATAAEKESGMGRQEQHEPRLNQLNRNVSLEFPAEELVSDNNLTRQYSDDSFD